MRQQVDQERYLSWSPESTAKVVQEYEAKYFAISDVLDANPGVLRLVDGDLQSLTPKNSGRGRKATFTSEILLRAMIVHLIEGGSLRDTEVQLSHNVFLQEFARLGTRSAPSFSLLCRCMKAVSPSTWERINDALTSFASDRGQIDATELRADTTVVESTIHYPTDSWLMWDSFRTLYRLLTKARVLVPGSVPDRFHIRKVKKLHLFITRYAKSPSPKRQRKVKRCKAQLIEQVARILDVASAYAKAMQAVPDGDVLWVVEQLKRFIPSITIVVSVARRAWIGGETVPARERVFSIFEPHTELIKRGRRSKPVEFGHAIWLGQARSRFITQYGVMEKKVPDCQLPERILAQHEKVFGHLPDTLVADKGFRGDRAAMDALRDQVKVVAIPQQLKDFADDTFVALQHWRAGIEGSISGLKRAFRLLRCPNRGFKSFAAHIGLSIFCHNLVVLATSPP